MLSKSHIPVDLTHSKFNWALVGRAYLQSFLFLPVSFLSGCAEVFSLLILSSLIRPYPNSTASPRIVKHHGPVYSLILLSCVDHSCLKLTPLYYALRALSTGSYREGDVDNLQIIAFILIVQNEVERILHLILIRR
jgi:hypothetical protein